ncbi:hypothetical protein JHK82_044012 [Glycine max]|nr:hypothetical protein JHK82_044012 [Glycine max]
MEGNDGFEQRECESREVNEAVYFNNLEGWYQIWKEMKDLIRENVRMGKYSLGVTESSKSGCTLFVFNREFFPIGSKLISYLLYQTSGRVGGVIARCSPLFEYPPTALIVITSAGATTSFLAATTGILQNDLKRVIAYSTCSQLGYMIFACGISNYSVSIFHLMNHAFFKALLFLSAGSVIHAMSDEQDMRKMGGLASSFPFTYAMMLMGSLSLIGFPFLTGFYSKDVILELAYTKYTISGNFAFWLGSVSVLFTSYYSFRSLFLTFLVPTNSFGRDILRCHDVPIPMAIPLILLALGSLFVGYLAKV